MSRKSTLISIGAAAALAIGCSETVEPENAWVRATIAGASFASDGSLESYYYDAPGYFSIGKDGQTRKPEKFLVLSAQRLESQGEGRLLNFYLGQPNIPARGRYPVTVPLRDGFRSDKFQLFFERQTGVEFSEGTRQIGAGSAKYVATDGWIEITRTTSEEVEGRFHVVATQIYSAIVDGHSEDGFSIERVLRDDPFYAPDLAYAPQVELTGSFRTRPVTEMNIVAVGRAGQ